jgi:hypothetical protein
MGQRIWGVMELHADRRRERLVKTYPNQFSAEAARTGFTMRTLGHPVIYYVMRFSSDLLESNPLGQTGELPDLQGQSGENP